MGEDRIERAMREWAAEKLSLPADEIVKVEFDRIMYGNCETCEYTSFGAIVKLTRNRTREIETGFYAATDIVREIAAKATA